MAEHIMTKGSWAEQMIMTAEKQLAGASIADKAACFQALAIKSFQRSTELAVDTVIKAMEDNLVEAGLIPAELDKVFEGVRMAVRKDQLDG